MPAQPPEPLVTFDMHRGRITIESTGEHLANILEAVIAAAKGADLQAAGSSQENPNGQSSDAKNGRSNIRDIARKLSYRNFYDRIAALLYYSTRIDGKATLSSKELDDLFGLCGFKKPARMYAALKYARTYYHYVDRTGRDQWALATAGENRTLELIESAGVPAGGPA